MLYPYGGLFVGHALAAAAAFGAFMLIDRPAGSARDPNAGAAPRGGPAGRGGRGLGVPGLAGDFGAGGGGAGVAPPPRAVVRRRHRAARRRVGRLPPGALRQALGIPLREHRKPGVCADGPRRRVPRPVVAAAGRVPGLPAVARLWAVRLFTGIGARSGRRGLAGLARAVAARGLSGAGDRAVDVPVPGGDEQLARRLVRGPALHRGGGPFPVPADPAAVAGDRPAQLGDGGAGRPHDRVRGAERRVGRGLSPLPGGAAEPSLPAVVPAAGAGLHPLRRGLGAGAARARRAAADRRWLRPARWPWWPGGRAGPLGGGGWPTRVQRRGWRRSS